MSPKILNISLVLLFSLLIGCNIQKSINRERFIKVDNSILDSIEVKKFPCKSIFVPKGSFQLDYNGQFRSLKSTLYSVYDSALFVSITSPLGSTIANCTLSKDSVSYIDFQRKKGYVFDYKYLSAALGLQVNFKVVQDILLGFHNTNSFNLKYNLENSELLESSKLLKGALFINSSSSDSPKINFVSFIFNKTIKKLNTSSITRTDKEPVFTLKYDWNIQKSSDFPKSVQLDFNFFEDIIGIDLEFKSLEFDVIKTTIFEKTTIQLSPLEL